MTSRINLPTQQIGVSVRTLDSLIELNDLPYFDKITSLEIYGVNLSKLIGQSDVWKRHLTEEKVARLPGKLITLNIIKCEIKSLYISKRLKSLTIDRSNVTEIDIEESKNGKIFITTLALRHFNLPHISLPSGLNELKLDKCFVEGLSSVNNLRLEKLTLRSITFPKMVEVSPNIKVNPIVYLRLPRSLRFLDVGNNNLGCLPILPNGLEILVADNNTLRAIQVTNFLRVIDFSNNFIQRLPTWRPSALIFADLRKNPLISIPPVWIPITRLHDVQIRRSEPGPSKWDIDPESPKSGTMDQCVKSEIGLVDWDEITRVGSSYHMDCNAANEA